MVGKMISRIARACTSGVTTGAGIYETLCVLGRERSLTRFNNTLTTQLGAP